jgi:hypothetical protein
MDPYAPDKAPFTAIGLAAAAVSFYLLILLSKG